MCNLPGFSEMLSKALAFFKNGVKKSAVYAFFSIISFPDEKLGLKKPNNLRRNRSNCTTGKAFTLHQADLDLIPRTTYGTLSTKNIVARSTARSTARCGPKPTLPPKKKTNQKKFFQGLLLAQIQPETEVGSAASKASD